LKATNPEEGRHGCDGGGGVENPHSWVLNLKGRPLSVSKTRERDGERVEGWHYIRRRKRKEEIDCYCEVLNVPSMSHISGITDEF